MRSILRRLNCIIRYRVEYSASRVGTALVTAYLYTDVLRYVTAKTARLDVGVRITVPAAGTRSVSSTLIVELIFFYSIFSLSRTRCSFITTRNHCVVHGVLTRIYHSAANTYVFTRFCTVLHAVSYLFYSGNRSRSRDRRGPLLYQFINSRRNSTTGLISATA